MEREVFRISEEDWKKLCREADYLEDVSAQEQEREERRLTGGSYITEVWNGDGDSTADLIEYMARDLREAISTVDTVDESELSGEESGVAQILQPFV